jgi:methionyl-tRNA formyltransferase
LPDPLRVAFFGLPLAGYLLARDGHDLRFAVLAPIAAPGRHRLERALGPAPLLDAAELGDSLEARVDALFERETPDLLVSWFWTRRLPERWLQAPRLGAIGAHPSLLPRHRGPNPYFWAIDQGDAETGVSIHRLTAEYDDGDVLLTRRLSVGDKNSWQLARALDRPSLAAIRDAVARFASGGALGFTSQREAEATWAPEPDGALLRANFHETTERVLRRIRALSPVPGLALEVEGLPLTVTSARPAGVFPLALIPGEAAVSDGWLVLRTGDGAIAVERAVVESADGETELVREELGATVGSHLEQARMSR